MTELLSQTPQGLPIAQSDGDRFRAALPADYNLSPVYRHEDIIMFEGTFKPTLEEAKAWELGDKLVISPSAALAMAAIQTLAEAGLNALPIDTNASDTERAVSGAEGAIRLTCYVKLAPDPNGGPAALWQ